MCSQCEDSDSDWEDEDDDSNPDYDRWDSFIDWLEGLSEYDRAQLAGITEPDDYGTGIIEALGNIADSVAGYVRDELRDGYRTTFEFQRWVDDNGFIRDWLDDNMLWETEAITAIAVIGELDSDDILRAIRTGQTVSEACVSRLTDIFSGFIQTLLSKIQDYRIHWDTDRL